MKVDKSDRNEAVIVINLKIFTFTTIRLIIAVLLIPFQQPSIPDPSAPYPNLILWQQSQ